MVPLHYVQHHSLWGSCKLTCFFFSRYLNTNLAPLGNCVQDDVAFGDLVFVFDTSKLLEIDTAAFKYLLLVEFIVRRLGFFVELFFRVF